VHIKNVTVNMNEARVFKDGEEIILTAMGIPPAADDA
jgi:hypothetical protein